MRKRGLFIGMFLMIVAFAAVATTLALTGNIKIMANRDDFDIYFSEAILDNLDVSSLVISEDKKSINFSTIDLKGEGDESILEYKVINNSTQYDADVEIICEPAGGNYYSISNSLNKQITAGSLESGTITVRLTKATINTFDINFTCTINVVAIEKITS